MTDPHYLKQEEFLRVTLSKFLRHVSADLFPMTERDRDLTIEAFIAKQPRSTVMVIQNGDGKVLAVTRRNRPEDWGLPGGKIDPGELPEEAAVRETTEETNVVVKAAYKCFERVDPTDGRVAWCYRATSWEGEPRSVEPGILVDWVDPKRLLEDQCTFKDYNRGVLTELGLL